MLLAKFSKPSRYIGILVTSWGTIVTLSGLVQNLAGLAVVRFLIGLFEAGFGKSLVLRVRGCVG